MKDTLQELRRAIEKETNISLLKRHRAIEYTYSRAIFAKIAYQIRHEKGRYSLPEIGNFLGRTHATVLNSINVTFEYAMQSPYWNELYVRLHKVFIQDPLTEANTINEVKMRSEIIKLRKKNALLEESMKNIRFEQGRFADLIKDLDAEERSQVYWRVENFVKITKKLNAQDKKESLVSTY